LTNTRLSLLESGINRVLAADPDSAARLEPMAGQTIRVDSWLLDDEINVYVTFEPDGIRLTRTFNGEVQATVAAGPLGLLRGAVTPGDRSVFSDGTLVISGDATLVQSFADLFRNYRSDWQGRLSPLIGEAATWRLESMLEALGRWRHDAAKSLAADAGEYLREEARLLAGGDAVRAFCDDVDDIASDVARLEQRVARLEREGR
jgi:ubiquinone biosynthesis protein UbiJ